MEVQYLDEKDIERVLSMLNHRNIKLLEENKEELDSMFYGVKKHLLLILRKYKKEFFYLLAYLNSNSDSVKSKLKEEFLRFSPPEVFISFMEDGTKFSVEDCKLLNLEDVNFFESVEKSVIREETLLGKHTYNDTNYAPLEFMELFEKGFSLNYVQRVVSNVAFNSNDSFVVCGPTGVGKTVIATMRIFKLFTDKKEKIKVAYVAPIKALGKEIYDFFSRIFVDLKVVLATSDVEINHEELRCSNIIVGTPERIDLIMRNTFLAFDLIILDEIHILNDTRGYVIEGIVSRAMKVSKTSFIGMSATVYNYEDIARFLGVFYYNLFYFGEEHRPSPLVHDVVLTDDLDKELDEVLSECNVPLVVFVHSQKDTLVTAERIKQYYPRLDNIHEIFTLDRDVDHYEALSSQLKELVFHGIGIHHSGLDKKTRSIIEEFYKKGFINILVSTSTLAWGVNLPIHDVIIKGSSYFNPEIGDYVELSNMEIRQMFGRAGRYPGMEGCKGILISMTTSNLYFNQTIESHILPNICNLVLVEIYLGATRFKDLIDWFKNTFYAVRLVKYNDNPFKLTKDILYTSLVLLREKEMINGFKITKYGKIAVKYFIDYRDVYSLCSGLDIRLTEESLLDLIGGFKEFRNIKGQIDVESNCSTNFGKMIHFYLDNQTTNDEVVNHSLNQIKNNFPRVMNAVFELCIAKCTPMALKAFELIKAFELGCAPGKSPFRNLKIDQVEDIEKKNIPYKVFRSMTEWDFKELGMVGYTSLKFLPNFTIDLQIYCELEDRRIVYFEIEKTFNDVKMHSVKYLFNIRDFYNSIILSDILYFYKEAEFQSFFYCIPKKRYIQVEIISFEMINTRISKAFDLTKVQTLYNCWKLTDQEITNIFNLSLNGRVLEIYDQTLYKPSKNEVLLVKNKEIKTKLKECKSMTHIEFIKMAPETVDSRYVLIDTHEISEVPTFKLLIDYCDKMEIDLIKTGLLPSTSLEENSIFRSSFGGFWSRVYDLTRALIREIEKYSFLSHLIVVSSHQVIDFLEDELEKKRNYKIVFFGDLEIDIYPKKEWDMVHIFDTQYFDYSTSSLIDYRMDVLCKLSAFGKHVRLYIHETKENLYVKDNSLQLLYKYKEDDVSLINEEDDRYQYLMKYEISPNSIEILEEGCKNNMGIKSILSLLFQIDELREEVFHPKYKTFRDVELGLKYIKTDYLMKHPKETDEVVLCSVKNAIDLFIDICSKKKYLKTMFNSIFIIQKMNIIEEKFFEIIVDTESVCIQIERRHHINLPVIFYVIHEDSSYFIMNIRETGIYKVGSRKETMYILCDKVAGYEKVRL